MKKVLSWLAIWLACAAVSLWALAAMPVNALAGSGKKGCRLAVSFDQLGNVAAGGDEDETFSARCWRRRDAEPYMTLVRLIDWAAYRITGEPDHCRGAFEDERLKRLSGKEKCSLESVV